MPQAPHVNPHMVPAQTGYWHTWKDWQIEKDSLSMPFSILEKPKCLMFANTTYAFRTSFYKGVFVIFLKINDLDS